MEFFKILNTICDGIQTNIYMIEMSPFFVFQDCWLSLPVV